MSQKVYPVQEPVGNRALVDKAKYEQWYAASVDDPETFWGEHGKRIDWFSPYTRVKNTSFTGDVSIKWFEDELWCINRV